MKLGIALFASHLVHSNSPGSTLILTFWSNLSPEKKKEVFLKKRKVHTKCYIWAAHSALFAVIFSLLK